MSYDPPTRDQGNVNFINDQINDQPNLSDAAHDESQRAMSDSSGLLNQHSEVGLARNNQSQLQAIQMKGENIFSKNVQKMALEANIKKKQSRFGANERSYNLAGKEVHFLNEIIIFAKPRQYYATNLCNTILFVICYIASSCIFNH